VENSMQLTGKESFDKILKQKSKLYTIMRKIYAIGESLMDIIFREGQPKTAKAGGSMLNSVVSLGRISLPVSFISEYGYDNVGDMINIFLLENGVDTSFVHRYHDGNTALALAFLNEKNDANYSFYKSYPAKRLDIDFPVLNKEDIVLFGSFYALSSEIRERFITFIRAAKEKGATIIYDPNIRKSHNNELESLRPLIIENLQMATIVRGSNEDFNNIFGANNPEEAWKTIRKYNNCMIYTYNSEGVYVRTSSFSGEFPVNKIKPVSTIGAGDSFNAGIIASFYRDNIFNNNIEELGENGWGKVIYTAKEFATHVCLSYDNYIDLAFASKYLSASGHQM
jgi:fructokinase